MIQDHATGVFSFSIPVSVHFTAQTPDISAGLPRQTSLKPENCANFRIGIALAANFNQQESYCFLPEDIFSKQQYVVAPCMFILEDSLELAKKAHIS